MMGSIFAKADAVLVSLGAHDHGSEDLFPMMKAFYETTQHADRWSG